MADDIGYTPGTGATVAADEVAGVLYQRVKPVHGADGSVTDTSATNPLPVAAVGNVAHAAADSGNPVKIGGKAIDYETMPTSVAVGDRVDAAYTPKGIAAVALFNPATEAALETIPVTVSNDVSLSSATLTALETVTIGTALPAGTNAIGKLAANSGVDIGDVDVTSLPGVAGDVAHDAADSGNPVKIGGVANSGTPTPVAIGDRVNAWYGLYGQQVVGVGAQVTPADGAANNELQVQAWNTNSGGKVGINPYVFNGTTWDRQRGDIANGLDVDVTRLPALVAGSANIGDVDVLTVPADPFGVNADAASATGSISAKLRFIAGTGIPITGTVTVGSHAVTNAGTFAVQDAAAEASLSAIAPDMANAATSLLGIHDTKLPAIQAPLELLDDTVATLGTTTYTEATSKGLAIGAVRRDADTTLVGTTNEFGPLQMDANGRLKVEAFSGETLPVSLASTTVTGTVAVTQSGTWDEVGINDSGNSITVDGTVTANLAAGTNNIGDVDVLSLPASTNTIEVVGDVAEDAALSGNPQRIGMRASTAIPTAMSADNDIVTPWANRNGAQVITTAPHVGLNSDPWNLVHETAQYTTTQTSTVLVTGGASEKIVVTKVQIQAGGTVAGALQLYFGTGAYSRGTSRAIFDGEFAPSATSKPGVVMDGPFIAGTNGDDLMVTDSAAINPLTITVWYYVVT